MQLQQQHRPFLGWWSLCLMLVSLLYLFSSCIDVAVSSTLATPSLLDDAASPWSRSSSDLRVQAMQQDEVELQLWPDGEVRGDHPGSSVSEHHKMRAATSMHNQTCFFSMDISGRVFTVDEFTCLYEAGYRQVIVRAYRSLCKVDEWAVQSMLNAQSVGMIVDVYMFPAVQCVTSPEQQVIDTLNNLANGSVTFRNFYFDIETEAWFDNCEKNQAWFREAADVAVSALGTERIGIYTVRGMWHDIMCNSTEWSALKLWYAHYNHPGPTFSDYFTPGYAFGGWTQPYLKQWNDSIPAPPNCQIVGDVDWGACQ